MAAVRLTALLVAALHGAPGDAAVPPGPVPGDAVPAPGTRPNTQAALTKIRPGSLLRAARPLPPAPDLRGPLELAGDADQLRHFSRTAVLDVIGEVAERAGDLALAERVEQARRAEQQRFVKAMHALRRQVAAARLAAAP